MFTFTLIVFATTIFLLIFDWIDKTIVALLGALFLIVAGVLTWEEAIHSIDFETIGLLMGLMFTVAIAQHSGVFSWLNVKIAKLSKGNPLAIFILFCLLTMVSSFVLNNATVVLLIIPVALALSQGLGLNSKLLVIGLAIFSNIGGTLTLIGDPPNTLIGVKAHLSFGEFVQNLWIPILIMTILSFAYIIFLNWKCLKPISKDLPKLFISNMIIKRIIYKFSAIKLDKFFVISTVLTILLTVIAFVFQPQIGLSVAVIGLLSGVVLSLLLSKKINFLHIVKEVEWDSLLFFAALFVQVGALGKIGFLDMIANYIGGFAHNFDLLLILIIWGIGLASAVINNIPLIALMIPVIFQLQAQMAGQPNLDLLWWALALGGCLGGNITIVGSSAGVLAVDAAKKYGVKISFMDYFKVGFPITIITLIVATGYILIRAHS